MLENSWTIQIVKEDGSESYQPFFGSFENAHEHCASMLATNPDIYCIVLLSEDYIPGEIASNHQIVADYQKFPIKGSVKWQR